MGHWGERWIGLDVWTDPSLEWTWLTVSPVHNWRGAVPRIEGVTIGTGRRRVDLRLLCLRSDSPSRALAAVGCGLVGTDCGDSV